MKRRVVITGLGVVAPNGIGKDEFWESIKNGRSGLGEITCFDASDYPTKIAGEVKDFDPLKFISSDRLRKTERVSQLALVASKLALEDASLLLGKIKAKRIGVVMGTMLGGLSFSIEQSFIFMEKGFSRLNPFTFHLATPSNVSMQIAAEFELKGFCRTFVDGWVSSFNALSYGRDLIQGNKADLMVVGGAESPLSPLVFASLCLARMMSRKETEDVPKPFDKNRDGTIMSEGGAVVILEELSHALARKADVYGEIVGIGNSFSPLFVPFEFKEESQVCAIKEALKEAKLKPKGIDYIQANGLGAFWGDKVESLGIRKVFGKHTAQIPVTSLKPITGHTGGASGVLDLIAVLLSLKYGLVPPMVNYKDPDPECDLDFVAGKAKRKELSCVMVNNFGFEGKNAVVIVKKIEW